MSDYAELIQPDTGQDAHTIHIVDAQGYADWLSAQPEQVRTLLAAQGFRPAAYAHAVLPGERGEDWAVVAAVADAAALSSWCLAKLARALPPGRYRLGMGEPGKAMFGWLTGHYSFDRYRRSQVEGDAGPRVLLTGEPGRIAEATREAAATALVRDLVNTPALDLGPAELERAVAALGEAHGAELTVTSGRALAEGYPMIHAVGRAAGVANAPRLIELVWGNPAHPRIAVVGKGVTFDSGGLDIKNAAGMRLMKKDMGGAAHALALAQMILDARLPVRLHLLIPAVENAISGDALRPGDVLRSRAGTTVEIGNTDAEGRLILADALTRAVEETPELIVDFATLTGAARVALGPDLPALFANDDALAQAMLDAGIARDDPCWRLPLWMAYEDMLASDIADIGNASDGAFAGAILAAVFLRKFVPDTIPWIHLDTFAWHATTRPGRPKGGAALGLRAAWGMLTARYPREPA